jgi:uncharacterized membrane protein
MPSKASLHHSRQIRLIIIITLFSHLIFACHVFEDFRTLSQPRQADYNNHIMLHYITLYYIIFIISFSFVMQSKASLHHSSHIGLFGTTRLSRLIVVSHAFEGIITSFQTNQAD